MPTFVLKIKAELDNIDQLIPLGHNEWKFNMREKGGDEEVKYGVTICDEELIDLKDSRGQAHFAVKFKGSASQAHANIVPIPLKHKSDGIYRKSDSGEFKAILAIECR